MKTDLELISFGGHCLHDNTFISSNGLFVSSLTQQIPIYSTFSSIPMEAMSSLFNSWL